MSSLSNFSFFSKNAYASNPKSDNILSALSIVVDSPAHDGEIRLIRQIHLAYGRVETLSARIFRSSD